MASKMDTKRLVLYKLAVASCVLFTMLSQSTGEKMWVRFESVVTHNALTTSFTAPSISTSLRNSVIISNTAWKICTGNNVVSLTFHIQQRSEVTGPCGQIQSPIVPSPQQIIVWELSVAPEFSLNLTFSHFILQYGIYQCQREWLEVTKLEYGEKVVIWTNCGEHLPWNSILNLNRIELEFCSWDGESYFRLLFQIYDSDTILGDKDTTYLLYPNKKT